MDFKLIEWSAECQAVDLENSSTDNSHQQQDSALPMQMQNILKYSLGNAAWPHTPIPEGSAAPLGPLSCFPDLTRELSVAKAGGLMQ